VWVKAPDNDEPEWVKLKIEGKVDSGEFIKRLK